MEATQTDPQAGSAMTPPLTRDERRLRVLMGVLAAMFALTTLSFLFTPGDTGARIAAIGRWAGFAEVPAPPIGGPWWPLAVSMMAMITVICALAWQDVRRHRGLIPILLVSKGVSSAVGLGAFFLVARAFHYMVVFTTDFPIFVLTAVLYVRSAPRR